MAYSNLSTLKADPVCVDNECKPKKPRSENPCCQVCGNVPANFSCSAFVCEACKKFFLRATKGNKSYVCTKGGVCEIGKSDRTRCPACRYRKCSDIGMLPPGQNLIDVTSVHSFKCKVCGRAASGFHYGTLTCEGCRIFFGRLCKSSKVGDLVCTNSFACNSEMILACRACRFRRCQENGMSPDAKRVGRQPNSVKHERYLEHQAASKSQTDVPQEQLLAVYNAEESREKLETAVSSTAAGHSTDLVYLPLCHGDHSSCANTLQLLKNDYMAFQEAAYEIDKLMLRIDGKLAKEQILELLLTNLKAVLYSQVKFLKKLPGFNELSLEDRMNITKSSLYKNALLLAAYQYESDINSPTFFMIKSGSRISNMLLETFPKITVNKGHFARCGSIVKQLNLASEEFALLTALNCFDPAVCSQVKDHSRFLSIHNRYMSLLGCYLRRRSSDPFKRFTELLNLLQVCSECRNEHSAMSKEFITNHMELYLQNDDVATLADMFKDIYLTD